MLRRLDLRGGPPDLGRLPAPLPDGGAPVATVRAILDDVRARGDAALREYTERFDGVALDDLRVPQAQLDQAIRELPPLLREALDAASASIAAYHRETVTPEVVFERDGVVVRELRRPVRRAGLYVPGGRARYPSTVLMTAVVARVAGVAELVLCSPPDRDIGSVASTTLAAAALVQVEEVYAVGGAEAIAAMAYGTETIDAVDVIAGPGNSFVAVAKREVAGVVGVPSAFTGPSEVVVVADESAPAEFAAIDLIVQAEHGPDGLAWLITWDERVADSIAESVAKLTAGAVRRAEIEATLDSNGYAVLVDGPDEAMVVANAIAPERLELMTADPEALLPLVQNAGAVFTGPFAPAAVGDYMAGPSHVLPTHRTARFGSALRVDDFVKHVHVVSVDEATLAGIGPHVVAIAEAEGLAAHADAIRVRAGW